MNATADTGVFAGLLTYEIVALAAGALLFLVGVWAVIQGVRKSVAATSGVGIACVVLSLLFIGYPSLKSLSVKNGFLELDAAFGNGETPTLSKEQQQQAIAKIDALAPRASTPEQKAILANAYRGVGELGRALTLAEKVDASNAPADVKKTLAPVFAARLKQAVQALPGTGAADPAKAAEIDSLVKKLDVPAADLSAQTRVTLAEGYAALGKDASAAANLDKAQAIKRDVHVDARLLQRLNRASPPSG